MSIVIRDPKRYRLAEIRRILHIDGTDSHVVTTWILDCAERSVRLRGFVSDAFWERAKADLIELAGWGSDEADEWLGEHGQDFPDKAPKKLTELQAWHKKLKVTQTQTVSQIRERAMNREVSQ